MVDAIKASKSKTTKIKSFKKGTIIDEENMEVVEIGEGDEKIDIDIVLQ